MEVEHDSSTQLNKDLIRALGSSRKLYICGQASSHCVKFTMQDLVYYLFGWTFGKKKEKKEELNMKDPEKIMGDIEIITPENIILLSDCEYI